MTARSAGYAEGQVPDMERRLASVVRLGTVHAVDYSNPRAPRVRVKAGKVITGWVPWTARAGHAREWRPLKVGEQVVLAAPSGDLAQAVVIGSIAYDDREVPATDAKQTVTAWDDGARESYDENSSAYVLDVPAGGTITFKIGGSSIVMTAQGIKLTTGSTSLDLTPGGTTLTTPQFTGQQS